MEKALKACSPNISYRSERDNTILDESMNSATASILDGMMEDDINDTQDEHDRSDAQGIEAPQEQETSLCAASSAPSSSTSSNVSPASLPGEHADMQSSLPAEQVQENVTSSTGSKHDQTFISSSFEEIHDAQSDSHTIQQAQPCISKQNSSAFASSEREGALEDDVSHDMTALAANIPLRPSPQKVHLPAAVAPLEEESILQPSDEHDDLTDIAARIPLPPSPIKPSPHSTQMRSPIKPPQSVATPLIDRTMRAADIPLPQSAAPSSRKSIFAAGLSASPVSEMTRQSIPSLPRFLAEMHAEQEQVDQEQEQMEVEMEVEEQLPFAAVDRLDSPVKHTTGPTEKRTLRQMPFASEEALPSPNKRQVVLQGPVKLGETIAHRATDSTEPSDSDSLEEPSSVSQITDNATANAPSMLAVSEAGCVALVPAFEDTKTAQRQEEMQDQAIGESSELNDSNDASDNSMNYSGNGDASNLETSEAGSPIPVALVEAQVLQQEHAEEQRDHSDVESRCTALETSSSSLTPSSAAHDEAATTSQPSSLPVSATPLRPSSSHTILSDAIYSMSASKSVSHAPNARNRILARMLSRSSTSTAASSSSSASSSLSTSSLDSPLHDAPSHHTPARNATPIMRAQKTEQAGNDAPPAQKTLKRKASVSSIAHQDDSDMASSSSSASTSSGSQHQRRITRQRSLTLLQNPQELAHDHSTRQAQDIKLMREDEHNMSKPDKGKKRAIDTMKDESEGAMQTEQTVQQGDEPPEAAQPAPRTRRQSTRLAATSNLPQPKSRIARRSAMPQATSSRGSTRLDPTDSKSKTNDESEESDAEDQVPSVVSRPSLAAVQTSATESGNGRSSTNAPITKRPQRSARPARLANVDPKALPSPGRAMSPVKKPLRAARVVNATTSKGKSKGKAGGDVGTAARTQVKVQLRSPSRVLLSSSSTGAAPGQALTSPGRVLPYQLPKSPRADSDTAQPSGVSKTLSPDRYRQVSVARALLNAASIVDEIVASQAASKIFGSSSDASLGQSSASTGPASSAASAIALHPNSSPFKGLAQRLTVSGSPSLLNLSVAPELLVLPPPSPSPRKDEHTLGASLIPPASSSSLTSMLKMSTSSAPDMRRMSTPGQMSPLQGAVNMSPRRALSAQPGGGLPRQELPSPRRVLPPASRAVPTVGSAAITGTPVRTASRVVFAQNARQPAPAVPPAIAPASIPVASSINAEVTPSRVHVTSASEAPRRSQRSARPQRMVKPVTRNVQSTPTAGPPKTVPATEAKPVVTAAQLQAITAQNTSANRKLYNKHKVTVIHKDEDRPPSPTSKIRKTGEEQNTRGAKAGSSSKEGKTARGALARATREKQSEASNLPATSLKRPHFAAAGDEGVYESPVKRGRSQDEESTAEARPAKVLKWDRDLLKSSVRLYTPPRSEKLIDKMPRRTVCRVSS